jgi:hypothetical protein
LFKQFDSLLKQPMIHQNCQDRKPAVDSPLKHFVQHVTGNVNTRTAPIHDRESDFQKLGVVGEPAFDDVGMNLTREIGTKA